MKELEEYSSLIFRQARKLLLGRNYRLDAELETLYEFFTLSPIS